MLLKDIFGILFLFQTVASQSSCQDYLQGLIDLKQSDGLVVMMQSLPQETVLYSGRELNDLGFYDSCLEVGFSYSLVKIKVDAFLQFLVGVCLPSQCDAQELNKYQDQSVEFINTEVFANKNYVQSVKFIDPQNVYPEFDVLAGFVLAFLSILILSSIIGSLLSIKNMFYPSGNNGDTKQLIEGHQKSKPVVEQIFLCFSFIDNLKKLFKINKKREEDDNFRMFNAIRIFSISFVIYGHEYVINTLNMKNLVSFDKIALRQIGLLTVSVGSYYAVDVFFFIGGFLTSVLMIEKFRTIKNLRMSIIPGLYIHRFLRLWPTYMTFLFIYWKLMPFIGNGPLWFKYINESGFCNENWWQNFLFIDNFFNHKGDYCFEWGWYMSNDFQIFLTAPPLLILYIRRPTVGKICTWALFIASITANLIIVQINSFHFAIPDPEATPQLTYYYFKPWTRCAPYYMGIILGYMYLDWKNEVPGFAVRAAQKIKQSGFIRLLMIIFGTVSIQWCIWAIIPIQRDSTSWTQFEQDMYLTFGRIIFLTGLALLLIPGLIKVKNDPVDYLQQFSSYTLKVIIGYFCAPSKGLFLCLSCSLCYINVHNIFFIANALFLSINAIQIIQQASYPAYMVPGMTILSFMGGTLLSLIVEVPLMNLEKIKMNSRPKKDDKNQTELKQKQTE